MVRIHLFFVCTACKTCGQKQQCWIIIFIFLMDVYIITTKNIAQQYHDLVLSLYRPALVMAHTTFTHTLIQSNIQKWHNWALEGSELCSRAHQVQVGRAGIKLWCYRQTAWRGGKDTQRQHYPTQVYYIVWCGIENGYQSIFLKSNQ